MGELEGKAAIVTGAGRGIGREVALSLAAAGASVLCMDKDEATCAKTAADIQATGRKALAIAGDVTNAETAKKVADTCQEQFGTVDILINNAGITRDGLLMRMPEEDWDLVLNINLKGMFIVTKAVVRHMVRQKSGVIVNVASVAGVMGNAGQANYSASKAGAIGFTKTCAKELGSRGIRANAVAPGFIGTEMTKNLPEDVREGVKKMVPLQRFGEPSEVADAILFLAGPRSSYITGQVLIIDGGMVM